ncbi:MAG: class I SAM-dependent methyltransferase [Caldilineaceae bacterium]|nr:class I SAM-dependent methyltransferase [Caldilineaceae bacterium]
MADMTGPYIPALRFRLLTPLYDPLLKWGLQEERFKQQLIAQAEIGPHMQVLDLGCGTGTLTVLLARAHSQAGLHGLDGDSAVLAIAAAKARHSGVHITWTQGLSHALPYPNNTFQRVTASLMVHHLNRDQKRRTFREVWRVLSPGGELHIADFGPPHSLVTGWMSRIIRRLEETADNLDGLLPFLLAESGFAEIVETGYLTSIVGPLSLYRAVKAPNVGR